jgi:hypothetical protein
LSWKCAPSPATAFRLADLQSLINQYHIRIHVPPLTVPVHTGIVDVEYRKLQGTVLRVPCLASCEKNIARDARVTTALENAGWRVLVAWECELGSAVKAQATGQRLAAIIRQA